MRPRSQDRAFTVVEVMAALAVLGLGAAGVIAMQKATLLANTNARNLVIANGIGQAWMERTRVDALAWNEPGNVPDLAQTQWLNNVSTSNGQWVALALSPPGGSTTEPAGSQFADVMGADIYTGDPSAPGFCTFARFTRFKSVKDTTTSSELYSMIRVEVRVIWDKSGRALDPKTDCPSQLPADYQAGRYGSVYLVSAVLENPSPI